MKKIILATAISLISINQIYASKSIISYYQTHPKEEKVAKMTALLNLSADQQKKYKDLLASSEKELDALKTKSKTASKVEKNKMQQAYKTNYETQLKKILTVDQFKKLQDEAAKKKKK